MLTNVQTRIEKDKLVIEIDISKGAIQRAKPSSTGKTVLVATTSGSTPVECQHANLSLALNLMAKRV